MSTLERSLSWLEAAADWANPILVKETRQSLKSRQFVVTFMLMLAISWFLFVMGVFGGGSALEYGAVGSMFFELFYCILAIAVMILVPFGAHRSLLAERDQATYDLLSITTLTPKQIVWGKLLSALVQVLIFYSAIAPFIAFTSLLQGFDFVFVASKLILTLLLALFMTMLAIASSTAVKHRQVQAFATIGGLIAIVWISISMLVGLDRVLREFDPTSSEAWTGLIFAVVIGASYFVLFQKIATAQLTFESDDRSSGIRIVCSAQFFLLWIGLLAFGWFVGGSSLDEAYVILAVIFSAIHLGVVGLFAGTEESFLSRRVRRDLPSGRFRRLIHVPFLQGGARGYLYTLLHVVVFTLFSFWSTAMYVTTGDFNVGVPVTISAYLVIYIGLACALGRWLNRLSSDIKPGHTRVLMMILLAVACVAPRLWLLWTNQYSYNYSYSILQITDPFSTIVEVGENTYSIAPIAMILGLGVIGVLLLNIRAIKQGIAEVLSADVRPRTEDEQIGGEN